MLYKILFEYLDKTFSDAPHIKADLIFDLPQCDLKQAQDNLFVKDLVRDAHIAHSWRGNASYDAYPESILEQYNGEILDVFHKIKIIYKRSPEEEESSQSEFSFYIYLDNFGEKYLPFEQLEFVSRREFDICYEAYQFNQMVMLQSQK